MDDWNQKTHGRSGLIDKVKASTLDEAAVEAASAGVPEEVFAGQGPLADVRQFDRPGPPLHGALHAGAGSLLPLPQPRRQHLKELCKRWQPEIYKGFKKKSKHTALADIRESIDELKYYREHFLKG
jgi:oligoribonuclease